MHMHSGTPYAMLKLTLLLFSILLLGQPAVTENITDHHAIRGPPKPTIVLVHGAWLTPMQYMELIVLLDMKGYRTIIQQLPSVDSQNPKAQTVATDAAFVRESLLCPEIQAGREVVLLMHSYGGFPGPIAANGLSKKELQARKESGGIIGMIMLSAFVALEGQSLLDKLPGKVYSDWIIQNNATGQLTIADPAYHFFNDLSTTAATNLAKTVKPQSKASFQSPAGPPAWANNTIYNDRRVYLQTALDHALPIDAQRSFLAESGVEWDVRTFQAGHCSFISQPEAVAQAVVAAAEVFQGSGVSGEGTTLNAGNISSSV
ncbi:hypothetical protein ACLMJK_008174 [Lecanora helva]